MTARIQIRGAPGMPGAAGAVAGLALLFLPDPALAQVGAAVDGAVTALEAVLRQAADTLGFWARQLLLGLLVLDTVWRGGRWLLSGQSVSAFAEPMLYTIGIVSLVWGFTTLVPEVVGWITWQATTLSNAALPGAGSSLSPSGIMAQGIDRATQWIGEVGIDPRTWAFFVCAFISLIATAMELAVLFFVYAELHLVGMVGIATLGFAGLTQTRGIAARYVMSLVGKGFKLLALLLVADAAHGLAQAVLDATMTTPSPTYVPRPMALAPVALTPSITLAGALGAVLMQVIGVVLIAILPPAVERLVAGSAVGDISGAGAKMVAGAAATGLMTAAGAAVGAAGGAAASGAAAAKTAGAGAFTGGGVNMDALRQGGTAAAKAASAGALKGAVNWGALGKDGRIMNELGHRLKSRVNRLGTGSEGGGQ